MKLAMAVGDNRHYTIDSIMPRHFLQTAARCGVPTSLVQGILDEIENDTERAIEATVNDLPPGFPERIVSSVIEGLRRRLRLFAHAIGNGAPERPMFVDYDTEIPPPRSTRGQR
jgi:serine/threonine-protein kinase HipA